MVTPLDSIKKSIHQVESNLSSTLSTANRLRDESRDGGGHGEGNETPEELDPEDARDRIEDVYEPLMNQSHRSQHHQEEEGEEGEARYISRDREDVVERKVHKLEVTITYLIFLILGACVLLPWNTEIVAGNYIKSRLQGSKLENSFSSWVALTFTTGNLIFLALANSTQHNANLSLRILSSILLIAIVLTIFIISTQISSISTSIFFPSLLFSTILLAAASSYLQNATVALSSRFGSMYLQAILSGQGAIGLAVALAQFFSALSASTSSSNASGVVEAGEDEGGARNAAFVFFLVVGIFSVFSAVCQGVLMRLPLYRLVIRGSGESQHHHKTSSPPPSLRIVEKKVRTLGLSIFYIFFITLSIFPSITSSILSTTPTSEQSKYQSPNLWIPIGFIIFSAGDWIGRALPGWARFRFEGKKRLAWLSIARTGFVPLFLMCNVQTGGTGGEEVVKGLIQSDFVFLLLMLLFSISNGYLSTLLMLSAIVDPSLESNEVDIAATCLAFYITLGLAVGSLASFGVRGVICGCNPFV